MSKLEKGQTITKTTEDTAVEIDGEMSMDAKLIGKFITNQVTVAMTEKSREYEKKIKNLRKAEKTECQESRHKKTVRGAVDAIHRKTNHPILKRPPILVFLRNLRIDRHKAERVSSEALREEDPNNQALPTAVRPKKGKRKK